jgi:AcrR family transcriptional regulator
MAKGYHHDNLRAALIEKGRSLLLRDGYAAFSLRRLASELEVSHAAPYRHFASREELIRAIVGEDMAAFNRSLAEGIRGISDPYERLYRLGEAYVFFFLDNPEVLQLFSTLPGQVAMQGEALATIFSSPEKCEPPGGRGDGGSPEKAGGPPGGLAYEADEGYSLLSQATGPFVARFPGLSEREIILGYWAKVHGLASLLVGQKGFLPDEGLRGRVKLLVRTPF